MQKLPSTVQTDSRKLVEDLYDFLGTIVRGWRLIAVCVGITLALAVIYLARVKPVYLASARLLVLQHGGQPLNVANGASNNNDTLFQSVDGSSNSLTTHMMIIRSPLIVGRSLAAAGLNELSAGSVIAGLSVKLPDPAARVLELSYKAGSRDEAVRVVDSVIKSYDLFLQENYQQNSNEVLGLITKARDELSADLKRLENVFGTKTLVDVAIDSGVEAFVMISTDKAVNPACVMGICKRLAEMYVQTLSEQTSARLVTVRFGNVLGSSGSVVPLFQEQIRQGGPVTVTHPEMTLYFMLIFMLIPEAAQLVLEAGALGQEGEIFVLDMGEPVGIPDLAGDLIRLSGLREDEDLEITFTGLRPGEKLHEELNDRGEEALPTLHPKIFLARHRPCALEPLQDQLAELARRLDGPADEVVAALQGVVPEYRPARLSDHSLWAECSPGAHPSNGHVAILGS